MPKISEGTVENERNILRLQYLQKKCEKLDRALVRLFKREKERPYEQRNFQLIGDLTRQSACLMTVKIQLQEIEWKLRSLNEACESGKRELESLSKNT